MHSDNAAPVDEAKERAEFEMWVSDIYRRAALDYILKREESLANAEGHAEVLRECAAETFREESCEYHIFEDKVRAAFEAGALALVENPALIAEVERLRETLKSLRTDAYIGTTTGVVGCGEMIATIEAALKEQSHE